MVVCFRGYLEEDTYFREAFEPQTTLQLKVEDLNKFFVALLDGTIHSPEDDLYKAFKEAMATQLVATYMLKHPEGNGCDRKSAATIPEEYVQSSRAPTLRSTRKSRMELFKRNAQVLDCASKFDLAFIALVLCKTLEDMENNLANSGKTNQEFKSLKIKMLTERGLRR